MSDAARELRTDAARGASPEAPRQLAILSLAIVLGMAPWFAATVVSQPLSVELRLGATAERWLTLAVQLGFVAGSVTSAGLLLADRLSARWLAAVSVLAASLATALLAWRPLPAAGVIALRFATGAALAGVYPPGIKMAAGWTQHRRGTAIGVLVGAVTLGSASPYLLRTFGSLEAWRPVLLAAAVSGAGSALLFALLAREGPYQAASTPFDPRAIGVVARDGGVRLATAGYLGHMWELYAMWSSIGLFFTYAFQRHGWPVVAAPAAAFAVIGAGAGGCVVAGIWADRIGKARVTIIAMAVSGACALLIGPSVRFHLALTLILGLVWGVSIVADSAQFSACVTELAPREYVGTAVTLQTALGFLLTMVTIVLVPRWAAQWSWTWAYAPLAIGPALGIAAMRRLWRERRI